MADIDEFANSLLEEAKRFLEKAALEGDEKAQSAYLHAALLLGFSALEAHVNAVCEEFATRHDLSPHERGLLLEREVRLEDGDFILRGLRMYRLDERLAFLHRRFSAAPIDKQAAWWSDLSNAMLVRNKLSHPKEPQEITRSTVHRALEAIIDTIDALYYAVYHRKFPAAGRCLQSKMDF